MALTLRFLMLAPALALPAQTPDPSYPEWTRILQTHYHPEHGMDYEGLARSDWRTMKELVSSFARVDPMALDPKARLAFYLNLYNLSVVNLMMENRQAASIRDLSTDPIIRINIFKKDLVQMKGGAISLQTLENRLIREGYKDPRVHFALNCAARSCPPLRQEAFVGTTVEAQLDDQTRWFFSNLALGARFEEKDGELVIHLTKIMDGGSWFRQDFESWGGGSLAFLRRHVSPERQRLMDRYSGRVRLAFNAYDWSLNRWNGPGH